MVRLVLLLALGGCRSLLGFDEVQLADGAPANDTPENDPPDADCFGSNLVVVCASSIDEVVLGELIDTDVDDRCVDVAGSCVIVGGRITLQQGSTVRVTGTRPFVLFADNLDIRGTLDLSSNAQQTGANSNAVGCGLGTPPADGGSGGGHGGTFGDVGGRGGSSDGSSGGASPDPKQFTTLRGGCDGGAGASVGNGLGAGGASGGAVYLLARESITMSGSINASGAGALGATGNAGGGGGGSGGMIGLESPTILLFDDARIWANGGGGGEGSPGIASGSDGGVSIDPAVPAPGGAGTAGGDGGSGGHGTTAAGQGADSLDRGGGGGGGSVGIVLLRGTVEGSGTISPPPR